MALPSPGNHTGNTTAGSLKIQLFGPFAVQIENVALPALRTRKGAWLLALLILHYPKPVERGRLAATLWPDSDPDVSLKNLRDSLYDLRKALGEQSKRLSFPTPATLTFDLTDAEVDLLTFDAWVESGDAGACRGLCGGHDAVGAREMFERSLVIYSDSVLRPILKASARP